MGWAHCRNSNGRECGYSVEATCDFPGCTEAIDRGLAFVCGGMHDGGENGCGGYFCDKHLTSGWRGENEEEYSGPVCHKCCEAFEKATPAEATP
jgi:hypothetical protein